MRPSTNERLRVFVSGASGVYGAHFAKLCLDAGHSVFSVMHTRKPVDSASLLGIRDRITWADGDIRDSGFLAECISKWEVQFVAHFAALPLVRTGTLTTEQIYSINTMGTVALLEAVKQFVKGGREINFLFISTDKALGEAGDIPYQEDFPLNARGVYEASKAAAEIACRSYQAQGLVPNLIISRSCNILSCGDLSWRLASNTIRQLLLGAQARVYTKGQSIREYISVHDAISAQMQLMLRADEYPGQTFHIGSGVQKTQEQMIHFIRDTHFPEGQIVRVDPPSWSRGLEIGYQTLDTTKIRRTLGWAPKKSFEETIAELVTWWREHKDLAAWSML